MGSYPTVSPLPKPKLGRFIFCGTFLEITPTGRYPASCSVEPGLSSPCAKASSGRLNYINGAILIWVVAYGNGLLVRRRILAAGGFRDGLLEGEDLVTLRSPPPRREVSGAAVATAGGLEFQEAIEGAAGSGPRALSHSRSLPLARDSS